MVPHGTRLAFRSNRTGVIELYERSANGGGVDRPLLPPEAYRTVPYGLFPTGWSPNGDLIASAPRRGGGMDLWLLPLGDTAPPRLLIGSPAQELHGNFSPDGRLLAYTSNETGRFEVFVETDPRSNRKWPISSNGGYEPRWEANGREVYYLSETRQLMAVAVGPGPSFGAPVALFQAHVPRGVTENRTHYVPSRDGRHFLVNVASDTPGPANYCSAQLELAPEQVRRADGGIVRTRRRRSRAHRPAVTREPATTARAGGTRSP